MPLVLIGIKPAVLSIRMRRMFKLEQNTFLRTGPCRARGVLNAGTIVKTLKSIQFKFAFALLELIILKPIMHHKRLCLMQATPAVLGPRDAPALVPIFYKSQQNES